MKDMPEPLFPDLKYQECEKLDVADAAALSRHHLSMDTGDNAAIFAALGPDPCSNMGLSIVSPLSSSLLPAAKHFGINCDPWMHAILFRDKNTPIIAICRGIAGNSVLGGLVLPSRRLAIEWRQTWYYEEVYRRRIDLMLPSILRYYNGITRKGLEVQNGNRWHVSLAIGNGRLGDYLMQLSWLGRMLDGPRAREYKINRILVNRNSQFIDPKDLFSGISHLVNVVDLPLDAENLTVVDLPLDVEKLVKADEQTLLSEAIHFSSLRDTERLRRAFQDLTKHPDSLKNDDLASLRLCDVKLWLSLELEKRLWVEQLAGLRQVLAYFEERTGPLGRRLGIVFAGMTGVVDGATENMLSNLRHRELTMIQSICRNLHKSTFVCNLAGRSLQEKAFFAKCIDFVVGPAGSATVLPSLIYEKPGVVYANRHRPAFKGPNTVSLDLGHVEDAPGHRGELHSESRQCMSYSIDPAVVLATIEPMFRVFSAQASHSQGVDSSSCGNG